MTPNEYGPGAEGKDTESTPAKITTSIKTTTYHAEQDQQIDADHRRICSHRRSTISIAQPETRPAGRDRGVPRRPRPR